MSKGIVWISKGIVKISKGIVRIWKRIASISIDRHCGAERRYGPN